jgi:glycosyltransferase involved in cell wall biosynthesis
MHDAAVFEDGAHKKNLTMWKQRVKWGALFARLASEADLFHTVSQYSADRIAHYFPSIRSRLRVVHNAVTDRFFEPLTERGQAYLRSAGLANKRYVLAPGGLHHRKNADLILSAWPKIAQANPDVSLVIANHCDPAYQAGGSAMPRVLMTGHVGDDELCALYKAADVMWFPSRYEGFGLPVLEAMASGTAVLASDSSSLPEVAGGAALLMPPGDASKHVEAMTWLLRDENARRQLIAKGTGRAACFRWSNAARQLHSEFLQLI